MLLDYEIPHLPQPPDYFKLETIMFRFAFLTIHLLRARLEFWTQINLQPENAWSFIEVVFCMASSACMHRLHPDMMSALDGEGVMEKWT